MNNAEETKKENQCNEDCNCEENTEVIEETEAAEIGEETLEEAEVKEDLEFEGIDEEQIKAIKDANVKLIEENKLTNNKLSAMQDKHLRLTAEYENYRKRTVKEKEQIYTDSCVDVLKEVLPVLDNLERAINASQEGGDLKVGVEMTLKQFKNGLEKLGIEEIPTEGKFDPNLHEAVMHIVDESYGESEIVEVFQKGYKRGEKVLRYSMVKVAN